MPSLVPRISSLAVAGLVAVGGTAAASAQGINPALKDLAAAANKEGSLTLSWSGSTFAGIQGAARYQAAINKMFGTNIRVNFLPGPDMARIANQLATEFTANQRAHVDLLLGASPQLTPLVKIDFFERVDWKQYLPNRITDQMIELDGRIIRIVTGLSGATYNSRLAPMKPTTLADFLRPEWKGKIASTPYSAGFDVLYAADVWGKERTTEYVTKLSAQITGLIRCGEAERIATGEYLALVMDCTGQDALQWQEKGAPVGQMMPLDAAQLRYYYFAIPKNAQHPNAAKLYSRVPDDRRRPAAVLRHLEDRPAFPSGLAHGQDGRRLPEAERAVQGSDGGMAAAASRDQHRPQRADQDSDHQAVVSTA